MFKVLRRRKISIAAYPFLGVRQFYIKKISNLGRETSNFNLPAQMIIQLPLAGIKPQAQRHAEQYK